ncbi:MAG: hypothetical protein KGJ02_03435 [Verrucomicrobiota bacterium]|nr:hypothetical protein [Verrucomicrobiota bacterium]
MACVANCYNKIHNGFYNAVSTVPALSHVKGWMQINSDDPLAAKVWKVAATVFTLFVGAALFAGVCSVLKTVVQWCATGRVEKKAEIDQDDLDQIEEDEISGMEDQVTGLEQQVKGLKEENQSLTNRVATLAQKKIDQQSTIDSLKGKISSQENVIRNVTAQNSEFAGQLTTTQKTLRKKEHQLENVTSDLNQLKAEIAKEDAIAKQATQDAGNLVQDPSAGEAKRAVGQ